MFKLFQRTKEREAEHENPVPNIEAFMKENGADDHGRTYQQVIRYNDEQLETDHTYIQWVFPTETPSMYNVTAPVVTKEEADILSTEYEVRQEMHLMFIRMMLFYGIRLTSNISLEDAGHEAIILFKQDNRVSWTADPEILDRWLRKNDHNLKRISRMLESLALFHMDTEHETLSRIIDGLVTFKPEIKEWNCWDYWETYKNRN